jgi:hypothetical protein
VPQKRSGYITVVYVVLGLAGFFLLTGIVGVWIFLHSETGQKIVATVGKSFTLIQEASRAPGTKELRDRGCTQAMVIPVDRMAELFREISPNVQREIDRETLPGTGTMVICQLPSDTPTPPSCADVARIYAQAVPTAAEQFGVTVGSQQKTTCDGVYKADGTYVAPMNRRGGRRTERPVESDTP